MSSKLELMKAMREAVHREHSYPVIIYPKNGGDPITVSARVHYGFTYLGDQLGTNFNYVEISDYSELKFIFWREELPGIKYGDLVTTPWGKTYMMDAEETQDKFTYKVLASMVPPNQEGVHPYPNG